MSIARIVTATEMRCLEDESVKLGISTAQLMENAGRAVAHSVHQVLGAIADKNITVLVGPGNNGGDGLVAARYLHDLGARVNVLLLNSRSESDYNLKLVRERGIVVMGPDMSGLGNPLEHTDAVLDAIFGTGQSRGIDGIYKEVLGKLTDIQQRRQGLLVFAVDLPSGLNADTGQPDPATPFVDHTLTLGLPKCGLYMPAGAARAGEITILDIGFPPYLAAQTGVELITAELAQALLPTRSPYANKGRFGRVMVVAGSMNYIGAAYLACAGAARVGAGLVALAAPESIIPTVATMIPEATYIPIPESTPGIILPEAAGLVKSAGEFNAILVGPGLGQKTETGIFLTCLLDVMSSACLVLDADAINALAKIPEWWHKLCIDAIMTPHPGEMARLTGLSIDEVQAERIALAQEKAIMWGKTVILKGAFTVVAAPDGRCRISPFANAALASAGTGDVLAGVVTGLLGQGLPLFDAATLGVYLHARAGERVKAKTGDTGILASDLLPELPQSIRELRDDRFA